MNQENMCNFVVAGETLIPVSKINWLDYSIRGVVDLHEYLAFPEGIRNNDLLNTIQVYFQNLLRLSQERPLLEGKDRYDDALTIQAILTLDAEEQYDTTDPDSLWDALVTRLPNAKSFTLDNLIVGNVREYYMVYQDGEPGFQCVKKDNWWHGSGLLDVMEAWKDTEKFTYKLCAYYPNSGEYEYRKIADGKSRNVKDLCTPQILESGLEIWDCDEISLFASFDEEKYPQIREALREYVRTRLPQDQLSYTEAAWEEDADAPEENRGTIMYCFCGSVQTLQDAEDFLEGINRILAPILSEADLDCFGQGDCYHRFGYATVDCTDTGFHVVGVAY